MLSYQISAYYEQTVFQSLDSYFQIYIDFLIQASIIADILSLVLSCFLPSLGYSTWPGVNGATSSSYDWGYLFSFTGRSSWWSCSGKNGSMPYPYIWFLI